MGLDDDQAMPRRQLAPPTALPHYYGDKVRQIFLTGGLIMLITTPFFNQYLPLPAFLPLVAVLVIALIAGLTNPMQRWVMIVNVVASLIALISFEYHAISQFKAIPWLLFGIDQLLAILFFFALYLSTKTLRGVMVSDYTIRRHKQQAREKSETTSYRRD